MLLPGDDTVHRKIRGEHQTRIVTLPITGSIIFATTLTLMLLPINVLTALFKDQIMADKKELTGINRAQLERFRREIGKFDVEIPEGDDVEIRAVQRTDACEV